jgi:hypothetical protein
MRPPPAAPHGDEPAVRLAELIAALSPATDLDTGQPIEHALRSCVVAVRLGGDRQRSSPVEAVFQTVQASDRFSREPRRLVGIALLPRHSGQMIRCVSDSPNIPLVFELFESRAVQLLRPSDIAKLELTDSQLAAELFVGMLRGDLHLRVVLGLRPPPDDAEKERFVHAAVRTFLDGCRTPGARMAGPSKRKGARSHA